MRNWTDEELKGEASPGVRAGITTMFTVIGLFFLYVTIEGIIAAPMQMLIFFSIIALIIGMYFSYKKYFEYKDKKESKI